MGGGGIIPLSLEGLDLEVGVLMWFQCGNFIKSFDITCGGDCPDGLITHSSSCLLLVLSR
jgi:hypothetical protein